MKKNKAFTLVEILVVIFIIAIFLGIATPSFFSWTKSSQIKADFGTCLSIQNIITNAIKSKQIKTDEKTYSIIWSSDNKDKIRTILGREMQTSPKVPNPKQNMCAFFVYLLPPYSVICLPINQINYIDTPNLAFDDIVTENFLLGRYPKSEYPQMYTSPYVDIDENSISVETPELNFPNIAELSESDTEPDNSFVGCINVANDF